METKTSTKDSNLEVVILLFVCWMLFSKFFWTLMPSLFDEFYSTAAFSSFSAISQFIWLFTPLLFAFFIKDPTKKMILFILAGIYILFGLYDIIKEYLAAPEPFEYFQF